MDMEIEACILLAIIYFETWSTAEQKDRILLVSLSLWLHAPGDFGKPVNCHKITITKLGAGFYTLQYDVKFSFILGSQVKLSCSLFNLPMFYLVVVMETIDF